MYLSQRGVSLFLSLIALLVMTLGSVALIRSIDSGSLMIGNLGFKQSATIGADRGVETAITWLQANQSNLLDTNNTANGYYATNLEGLDITGNAAGSSTRIIIDWNNNNCSSDSKQYGGCIDPKPSNDVNGNSITYLISRLCKTQESINSGTNSCVKSNTSSSESAKRGELKYNEDKRFSGTSTPYYRIIVRAQGPRNTVSYTETIVHF